MNSRFRFYSIPTNPLARIGLALLGLGVLVLSFVVGAFVLVAAMGLAIMAGLVLTVRRWLGLGQTHHPDPQGPIDVEYRVIRRERRDPDSND